GPDMDDEDYGLDDETQGRDDEDRGIDDEGHSVESDRLSLEEEEVVPEAQWQEALVMGTTVSTPLGLSYEALRRRELALEGGDVYSTFETSGSLPISPSHSDVPSPISSPMIPLTIATPATVETEGFLTELGAQVEMQGGLIHDHVVGRVREEIFSQRYQFRSLEYEQERVAVTFGMIWRPLLALEAWAGQTDAQRAALWHAVSDVQGENQDLRLQLAEE
ncbi:hypothetical protein Tco_0125805, partial [Tanacetum coccineum]